MKLYKILFTVSGVAAVKMVLNNAPDRAEVWAISFLIAFISFLLACVAKAYHDDPETMKAVFLIYLIQKITRLRYDHETAEWLSYDPERDRKL